MIINFATDHPYMMMPPFTLSTPCDFVAQVQEHGRPRGLILKLERLRLTTLTLSLQHAAEHLLGCQEDPQAETPDWKPLTIEQRCAV